MTCRCHLRPIVVVGAASAGVRPRRRFKARESGLPQDLLNIADPTHKATGDTLAVIQGDAGKHPRSQFEHTAMTTQNYVQHLLLSDLDDRVRIGIVGGLQQRPGELDRGWSKVSQHLFDFGDVWLGSQRARTANPHEAQRQGPLPLTSFPESGNMRPNPAQTHRVKAPASGEARSWRGQQRVLKGFPSTCDHVGIELRHVILFLTETIPHLELAVTHSLNSVMRQAQWL
jgi:hypothetical protein